MSENESSVESEISIPQEEDEGPNIGLYIGGRNALGQRHGRGWAILPNGDQYDGDYRKGRRHGMGLYVFKDGARYYGQYRCGKRSGRGIFIYPDGTVYEGNWRKHLKHGKGVYNYANGDIYSGDWYRGVRHGVGIYTFNTKMDNCCITVRLKGTWQQNLLIGPFELYMSNDDKCTVLHGISDTLYPNGPAVFNFDNRYLLMGFFLSPNAKTIKGDNSYDVEEDVTELELEDTEFMEISPTVWHAQEMCVYDYSLLPQEPVPLPLSDSELSVCSLSSVSVRVSEPIPSYYGEAEEGEEAEEIECVPVECEYSLSELETETEPCKIDASPCAIEIVKQNECQ